MTFPCVYPLPLFFLLSILCGVVEGGWIWKYGVSGFHLEDRAPQLALFANTLLQDFNRQASLWQEETW